MPSHTETEEREVRAWLEEVLGERIEQGALSEVLKDGVVLCRAVNAIIERGRAMGGAPAVGGAQHAPREASQHAAQSAQQHAARSATLADAQSAHLHSTKCPSRSQLGFFQMENIAYFISKARDLGVPDCENFLTIDLFEGKDLRQVFTCIYSLSRNLYKNGRTDIRVIGPKLVEKVPISFTKEQLDEAKRTVSRQYGSISKQ